MMEEKRAERVSRLVYSLNEFENALSIERGDVRSEEVLKRVEPLIREIERSYDFIPKTELPDYRELHEIIAPLIVSAKIQESSKLILRCAERATNLLREQAREYDIIGEIEGSFENLKDSINSIASKNFRRVESYLEAENLYPRVSNLLNRSIGDLLEWFYAPRLVAREGYTLKPRVIDTEIGDVQLDVRGEKDDVVGFENLERLRSRRVILVEAKTTVTSQDIDDLARKRKAIVDVYQKDSRLWKYKLHIDTWLVACYGWDDELKAYARGHNITSIDKKELETRLRQHNLLVRSRPPCPKQ